LLADPLDRVVGDAQVAELRQVGRGAVERPTGPGQRQHAAGARADRAVADAGPVVQRAAAGGTGRAVVAATVQADVAHGGQDLPGLAGLELGPTAARARPETPDPFFCASSRAPAVVVMIARSSAKPLS